MDFQIVPFADSLQLNEQDLAFLSKIGNGPFTEQYPVRSGALHVHKVSLFPVSKAFRK